MKAARIKIGVRTSSEESPANGSYANERDRRAGILSCRRGGLSQQFSERVSPDLGRLISLFLSGVLLDGLDLTATAFGCARARPKRGPLPLARRVHTHALAPRDVRALFFLSTGKRMTGRTRAAR